MTSRVKVCRDGFGGTKGILSRSIFLVEAVTFEGLIVRKDTPTSWKTFLARSWVRWAPRRPRVAK